MGDDAALEAEGGVGGIVGGGLLLPAPLVETFGNVCGAEAGDALDLAEDVAQDAFLTAFERVSEYRGEGTFSSWVRRIAARTVAERIAAGCDGLILEVHHDPAHAASDGYQTLSLTQFADLMQRGRKVAEAVGKTM